MNSSPCIVLLLGIAWSGAFELLCDAGPCNAGLFSKETKDFPSTIQFTSLTLHALAAGGSGVVYTSPHREHSVFKVLWPEGEKWHSYWRELANWLRLPKSNCTVNFIAMHQVQDFYIIESEKMSQTLFDWSNNSPTLRDQEVMLTEIALCLQWLHNRGFVHSDIKPRNVMISASGSPKLNDFTLTSPCELKGGTPDFLPSDFGNLMTPGPKKPGFDWVALVKSFGSEPPLPRLVRHVKKDAFKEGFSSANLIDNLRSYITSKYNMELPLPGCGIFDEGQAIVNSATLLSLARQAPAAALNGDPAESLYLHAVQGFRRVLEHNPYNSRARLCLAKAYLDPPKISRSWNLNDRFVDGPAVYYRRLALEQLQYGLIYCQVQCDFGRGDCSAQSDCLLMADELVTFPRDPTDVILDRRTLLLTVLNGKYLWNYENGAMVVPASNGKICWSGNCVSSGSRPARKPRPEQRLNAGRNQSHVLECENIDWSNHDPRNCKFQNYEDLPIAHFDSRAKADIVF